MSSSRRKSTTAEAAAGATAGTAAGAAAGAAAGTAVGGAGEAAAGAVAIRSKRTSGKSSGILNAVWKRILFLFCVVHEILESRMHDLVLPCVSESGNAVGYDNGKSRSDED